MSLILRVARCWTFSRTSMSFLFHGRHAVTAYSRWGLTNTLYIWSIMTQFLRNHHLRVHHVFRLRMVWIWPAVGSPRTWGALIILKYAAIQNMYRLGQSTREYLRKMAQNCPLVSKKPWQNFPNPCEHRCVIATQVVIFDWFFSGFQRRWFYNVVQVFSAISIDPSSHSYPINTCYSVNNENLVFLI